MVDLEIRYPSDLDVLPFTTTVSVSIGDNINALRDAILNIEEVLGLDVNIGLFTPDPEGATVADRLNRIERGIAERNLVFREINVSDALQVLLNQNNEPFVNIGLGSTTTVAPVTIKGPLTVLSPTLAQPRTIIQTPVSIDVTTFNTEMSASSLIKGKANALEPILRVHDTSDAYDSVALHVIGNMKVEGVLETDYSINHNTLLNIDTVPTDSTRGEVKHVTQGDFHSHRKGRYDEDRGTWIVDSSTSTDDFGVLSHRDLQGWGTLPTHGNDFVPEADVKYHVTGGDLHSHSTGDGAQIDHTNLKNISPKFSNHVTGGDAHRHTSANDGGQISHLDLGDTNTTGTNAVHVTTGDAHTHGLDEDGNPIGDGAQIDHAHLLNTSPSTTNHVTGGDAHTHGADGDGGTIDHDNLSNRGSLSHTEIDASINTFRATTTGTASFTASTFNEIEITHGLGTDQFNVAWSLSGVNIAPPSPPANVGTIYVGEKNSTSFKLNRIGGSIPGPAVAAQLTTNFASANQNINFIAREPGADGNDISIEYQSETSGDPILTETINGKDIFIQATSTPPTFVFHFDASDIPTASETRAALLNNALFATFVTADLVGDGSGVIDAYAAANFSGGADTSSFQSMEVEWIAVAIT